MTYIFLVAPILGVLTALAAIIAEQLLSVGANIFLKIEIIPSAFAHLGFFIVAAAIIEESCKYIAATRVLRRNFGLRGFKFIFAAVVTGLFFGLTEAFLVLLANGKKVSDIGSLGSETTFSLAIVILTHILTMIFIGALIAGRREKSKLDALKTIIPPAFVHLLVNFLIIQKGDFTNWLIGITLGIVFIANLLIITFSFRRLD